MIATDEKFRVLTCFGLLGVASVLLVGRLADLQAAPDPAALRRADREEHRTESLPSPRGTILDRHGDPLAYDRPVWEIRAEITLRSRDVDGVPGFGVARDRFVADVLWALGKDRTNSDDLRPIDELRVRLTRRVDRAIARGVERGKVVGSRLRVDVLVAPRLDDAAAVEALRSLDQRTSTTSARTDSEPSPYRVAMHLMRRNERVYPYREHTAGVVGTVRRAAVEGLDDRLGVSGLERLDVLLPGDAGARTYRIRAGGASFWANRLKPSDRASIVRTTLDLDLQIEADRQLLTAVEAVADHYGSPPEWGALLLVDVESGGLRAMASYTAGRDGSRDLHGAFAPTHRVFEPGSVVKPLHIAMALDRGLTHWGESIDCRPGYRAGSEYASQIGRLPRRKITDSHPNTVLELREVLVRSSNIGAVRLGLRLGAEGLEEYLRNYGFGTPTGVMLPGELKGSRPPYLPDMRRNEQFVYTGPSIAFGYQIATTPLQVARAFLSLVSCRSRALRLVESVELGDRRVARPDEPRGEPFIGPEALALVKEALLGVVLDSHGTARHLGEILREQQSPWAIAGKTGTSEYSGEAVRFDGKRVRAMIRTASFAGFAPVEEPRFLVLCVLQKVGASAFYGGRYSAPAAGRLLLHALE